MEICNHVHQIRIDFNVTEDVKRYVYVYLLTGSSCFLIDAGVAGASREIENYMESIGRRLEEIEGIFLTHSHPDHIGGALEIQELAHCKIYAGARERDWMEDIDRQFAERPIPNFYKLVNASVKIDKILAEGETIVLEEGMTLSAAEVPGHSRGSMAYCLDKGKVKVLFTGDSIPAKGDPPIFTDSGKSKETIEKIRRMQGIDFYCPAWDRVYASDEISAILDSAFHIIADIEKCSAAVFLEYADRSMEEKMGQICKELRMEHLSRNPLFYRSVLGSLEHR